MDDMSGETFIEFQGPSLEELSIPPVLHAVPASTVGPLEHNLLVTIAASTGWIIDETLIVDGPTGLDNDETYRVVALSEYGAVQVRPHEQDPALAPSVIVQTRSMPTSLLWVYRPAPGAHDVEDIPAWHSGMWFENVLEGGPSATPPTPRRPRPARELPSLTGQRLYGPALTSAGAASAEWRWWIAVTEPIAEGTSIFVRCVTPPGYERACNGAEEPWVGIPLYRLFAY